MLCDIYEVPEERIQRPNFFGALEFSYFSKLGKFEADRILDDSNITLYSLNIEKNQAVFVETPPEVHLLTAPFYNLAQFENASRVITISFDTLIQLGEEVSLEDDHLVLIFNTGRCGSTLASQIFAQVPGIINMAEPIALTNLVVARNAKKYSEQDLVTILNATIRLLCKNNSEIAWVIKGRSFDIELGDWMHQLFPRSKNIFLYRNAESWLQSFIRAFDRGEEVTDDDRVSNNKNRREFMNSLVPEIAQINSEKSLNHVDMLSIMWLATMSRYLEWTKKGIEMLAIKYASWLSSPLETAEIMLDYCKCKPKNMSEIKTVFGRDSQAGTRLSRVALQNNKREITKCDIESCISILEITLLSIMRILRLQTP